MNCCVTASLISKISKMYASLSQVHPSMAVSGEKVWFFTQSKLTMKVHECTWTSMEFYGKKPQGGDSQRKRICLWKMVCNTQSWTWPQVVSPMHVNQSLAMNCNERFVWAEIHSNCYIYSVQKKKVNGPEGAKYYREGNICRSEPVGLLFLTTVLH